MKNLHTIYLAGGCFWGVQAYLKRIHGICESEVGYANGMTQNPTYEKVCHKNTGHAEAVKIIFDTNVITLSKLLEHYFSIINPTLQNRQGNDIGSQYRTGVYYIDNDDLNIIQDVLKKEQLKYEQAIVTEVEPLQNYFKAETYHQDYLDKNPNGYCHINLT